MATKKELCVQIVEGCKWARPQLQKAIKEAEKNNETWKAWILRSGEFLVNDAEHNPERYIDHAEDFLNWLHAQFN